MVRVKIVITYCQALNYQPRAAGLAARIREELGIEAELKKGAGGVFDVEADGRLVFSKHRESRYPEPEEILRALRGA